MQQILHFLHETFVQKFDGWLLIGIAAQLMFTCRFIVQWIVSERAGESLIPLTFWLFSVAGGLLTIAYGIAKREPVIIFGQFLGLLVYLRNLMLILRTRRIVSVN